MTKLYIVFSHGKESGPWGSKITKMAEYAKSICDCEIQSIDYQDLASPDDRVQRLVDFLKALDGKIILVGSSMGGYVSTVASNQIEVDGLMLLAPAFNLPGYKVQNPTTPCKNLQVIHGWHDDIVPYQNSVEFAKQHNAKLTLVNDGHRLSGSDKELSMILEQLIEKLGK
ncbi:MAG: hypothetical protein KDI92_16070 [Xanthomonadales bacterium]|nr:hypothetical protein [Xanthomonadales bacterium]